MAPKTQRPKPEEATVEESDPKNTISKAEAVRLALKAGKEMPEEGVNYIKRQFGIEIDKQHFSTQKSQIKKKAAAAAEVTGGRVMGVHVYSSSKQLSGEMELLDAIEAIKPLVASLGVDKVKRLADLLG